MPIYEYECIKCKRHHEIVQKITDKPLTVCPDCNGVLKKMISHTSFVLKGTGWYVTDYARNNRKDETSGGTAHVKDKTGKSGKSDRQAQETGTLSKTETGKKSEPDKTAVAK